MTSKDLNLKSTILCRHCGKKMDLDPNPFRPFCSDRCRKIDLGKWFGESYRIPDKDTPIPETDTGFEGSRDEGSENE